MGFDAADLELFGYGEVVHRGGVEAEDLALLVGGQRRVFGHVLGDLEVDEPFDQPFRGPERVVAGELDAVFVEPVEKFADDLGEVARAGVDERHRDGESGVDVGFLGGDPAEVFEPGEPAVFDDEVEVGVVGGDLVDVGDVEGVAVEGADGRALWMWMLRMPRSRQVSR